MPKESLSADSLFTIRVSFSPASSTTPSSRKALHFFLPSESYRPASLQPFFITRLFHASRVPDVGGGAMIFIAMFGRDESIWFHLIGFGPCSAIAIQSCLRVKLSFLPFKLFEKAIPSFPTITSIMSVTPFFSHIFFSLLFIAREAFVISGYFVPTPAQKSFIPPPVPVLSITGVLKPF